MPIWAVAAAAQGWNFALLGENYLAHLAVVSQTWTYSEASDLILKAVLARTSGAKGERQRRAGVKKGCVHFRKW